VKRKERKKRQRRETKRGPPGTEIHMGGKGENGTTRRAGKEGKIRDAQGHKRQGGAL